MNTSSYSHWDACAPFLRRMTLFLVVTMSCVQMARSQNATLQSAIEAYSEADFDKAIELFTDVSENSSSDVESRMEAYQYLARLYVAKQMEGEARTSIQELLELEPPLAEFNSYAERPDLMTLYYDVRREVSDGYEVERANDQIQTIAVLDFENGSIGSDPGQYALLSAHLASKMINFLNGSVDLKVIERERLDWILDELQLQRNGNIVDQGTAVRVGKLLGAQSVLFGNFAVIGRDLDLGVRMVNVETSEILLGADANGRLNDIFDLVKELSLEIAQKINASLDETTINESGESRNLDAIMSYQAGVELMEQKQYAAAYNKFQEALSHDPGYALAALRINGLEPTLN